MTTCQCPSWALAAHQRAVLEITRFNLASICLRFKGIVQSRKTQCDCVTQQHLGEFTMLWPCYVGQILSGIRAEKSNIAQSRNTDLSLPLNSAACRVPIPTQICTVLRIASSVESMSRLLTDCVGMHDLHWRVGRNVGLFSSESNTLCAWLSTAK